MKFRTALALGAGAALAAVGSLTGLGRQDAPELKAGDDAPPYSLPGSDGKTYERADYQGKSAVVLAWFPKAFTGG